MCSNFIVKFLNEIRFLIAGHYMDNVPFRFVYLKATHNVTLLWAKYYLVGACLGFGLVPCLGFLISEQQNENKSDRVVLGMTVKDDFYLLHRSFIKFILPATFFVFMIRDII